MRTAARCVRGPARRWESIARGQGSSIGLRQFFARGRLARWDPAIVPFADHGRAAYQSSCFARKQVLDRRPAPSRGDPISLGRAPDGGWSAHPETGMIDKIPAEQTSVIASALSLCPLWLSSRLDVLAFCMVPALDRYI